MSAELRSNGSPFPSLDTSRATLPDVALDGRPRASGRLDRVGMTGIETVVRLPGDPAPFQLPARVDAFVDLDDPRAKGIHMSRMVLALERALSGGELTPRLLEGLLRQLRSDQGSLSRSAEVHIRTSHPITRTSLLSAIAGRRIYPFSWSGRLDPGDSVRLALGTTITYSSTCPCAQALSRDALLASFWSRFRDLDEIPIAEALDWIGEDGLLPVPHSQRSSAEVGVQIDPQADPLAPRELIDLVEEALGTPVQAVVKRVDEQEFARRSGARPLFCEDAAREVAAALAADPRITAHRVRVEHRESLHPHDAVAEVSSPDWVWT
ncbi:MAG: GTP cyclohydrolase FolE2 [Myxococcota bacterium]